MLALQVTLLRASMQIGGLTYKVCDAIVVQSSRTAIRGVCDSC